MGRNHDRVRSAQDGWLLKRMTMKTIGSKIICALAAFAVAALAAVPAQAALEIKLDQGVVQPIPIAITEFLGANPRDQQTAAQIAGVVRGDLERSGLFA